MLNDRFWTKVDRYHPSGCWVWLANRNNKGYGLFRPGGTLPKELAHRLSYAEANGQIPKGSLILHSCDNPACVNPDHLRVGDHKANTADMDSRGRRNNNTPKGEANCNARMTADAVVRLRLRYVAGDPLSDLVREFGCSENALPDYTTGRSWKHVLGVNGCPTLDELRAEGARRRRNNAKVTVQDAADIRAALASGETGRSVAARYGIHKATVSDIKLGKIWPMEA